MAVRAMDTLDVRSRRAWRRWLAANHGRSNGVWLVFHKRHTGVNCLEYDDAVEEALCYGWIDSVLRRLDEARYVRKFTPRRPGSVWSALNRRRYADLARRGRLAQPGRERPPTGRTYDRPPPPVPELPAYIRRALTARPRAWEAFRRLAPSYRRLYVRWVHSARREETRARRLREVVRVLLAGEALGLK